METEQKCTSAITESKTPRAGSEFEKKSSLQDEFWAQTWKEVFRNEEQYYGPRFVAISVALKYFEATAYPHDNSGYHIGIGLACQAYLPRIMRNAELAEIFLTTTRLLAEEKKCLVEGKSLNEANDRLWEYVEQVESRSQPVIENEQTPLQPLVCEEAQRCVEQLQPIPLEHIKECPTCSVTQRGERRQPDFATESKEAVT